MLGILGTRNKTSSWHSLSSGIGQSDERGDYNVRWRVQMLQTRSKWKAWEGHSGRGLVCGRGYWRLYQEVISLWFFYSGMYFKAMERGRVYLFFSWKYLEYFLSCFYDILDSESQADNRSNPNTWQESSTYLVLRKHFSNQIKLHIQVKSLPSFLHHKIKLMD